MNIVTLIQKFGALKYTYTEIQFAVCSAIGEQKMLSKLTQDEIELVYRYLSL